MHSLYITFLYIWGVMFVAVVILALITAKNTEKPKILITCVIGIFVVIVIAITVSTVVANQHIGQP